MSNKKWHFETLQLHVGQEQADEQYLFIRLLRTFFTTSSMQRIVSHLAMQATFMVV